MAREGLDFNVRSLEPALTGRGMADAMRDAADAGKSWAQAEARRTAYDPKGQGRHYADSFEVRTTTEKVNGVNRVVAELVNVDPKAWAVEWGHGGHHIMQQAVDVVKRRR